MFNRILGIPAHPLLIHAAVIFIPLLIVGAIAYAAFPAIRRKIDWAVVALAVIAPFAAWFAKLSGESLKRQLIAKNFGADIIAKITVHQSYGNKTFWLTLGLGVATLAMFAYHVTRRAKAMSADDGAGPADRNSKFVWIGWTVLFVVLGGITGYYVFKTGDTGAHIVWQGI